MTLLILRKSVKTNTVAIAHFSRNKDAVFNKSTNVRSTDIKIFCGFLC